MEGEKSIIEDVTGEEIKIYDELAKPMNDIWEKDLWD